MSRRAAARLEVFGYENVCVYAPGKQDWLAFGLPFEGELAKIETAGRIADRDVATCGPGEKLGDIHTRTSATGREECVVVNDERVVLGLLHNEAWRGDEALSVEQVMDLAPLTFRPHLTMKEAAERMRKQERKVALVTDPDGKLIGLLRHREAT